MSDKCIGAFLLGISAVIWGGTFIVVRVVVQDIEPILLVWLRYVVAIIFLLVFSTYEKEWHFEKKDIGLMVLIGIIGNTLSIIAQETGVYFSSAQMGAVVTSSSSVFMLIFASLLLGESINRLKIFSVLLAIAGVIMIVGFNFTGERLLIGVGLLVVAALTWGLMCVLVKMVSDFYTPLQITTIGTIIAIICLTPYAFYHFPELAQIHFGEVKIWFGLFYLGGISTAAAFVIWNKGLLLMKDTATAGLFGLLQPVVGTLLGYLLLGEPIYFNFVLGAAMIIISVYLTLKFCK